MRDDWFADADVLGVARSVEPPGVLPYIARRLDAGSPAGEHEAELEVEALHVDATSFRVIRERSDGDEQRMAALILDVVRERGKLQNPWTGSGGILAGRVTRVGERFWQPQLLGELVVPLASLVAIPLRLDEVGSVSSPHVPARGRAIVTGRMSCAVVPDDLPLAVTMSALDVYPAASHARSLTRPGDHVLVLGAGNAGLLAAAAADEAGGVVTAVDVAQEALERVTAADEGARGRDRQRRGAARAGPARRSHARLHERPGLRGDGDPRHGGHRHGAVLLDRDVVPGRGARRRRDQLARAARDPERLHRGSRRVRARPAAAAAVAARGVRGVTHLRQER